MLQNMREKSQGIITWAIVLFIIGAFAFFGLTDYFSFGSNQSVAAKVNGQKITWKTVDAMYERLLRQYGNQVDPATLKEQIRMGLVQRTALMSKANSLGFRVGDDQVASALLQIPAFQEKGKFSKELYLKILSDASYTDAGFRQELAHDILLGQLEQGVAASSFTMPLELSNTVALLDQKRDFGYFVIPIKYAEKDIKVSADDIKTYYDGHKDNYIKPEQVSLEYVELTLEDFIKQISVSKEEALAYYNEHQAAYTAPERVRVRHILIPLAEKEKAQTVLAEIKNKADFAKLAKQNSIDTGSAEKGGELGWFARGQMVPEFEKAAFELKNPGDISELVETKFGYHILKLEEHKNSEVRPFVEAKTMVEEQLKHEKAQVLFAEKAEKLAKLAFEQATSLAPIAEQLGLKLQTTESFTREGGQAGAGFTNNPEVIKAAFSEAVKKGNNSEPLKLAENVMAIIRIKSQQPSVQQPLEAVEKQVKETILADRAKSKIKELGDTLVKRIQSGEKPSEVARSEKLEWKTRTDINRMQSQKDADRNIIITAFQVPSENITPEKPGVKGFSMPDGNYVVIAVTKIIPGDIAKLDTGTKNAYQQSLTEVSSQLEFALYANQVLKDAKIEFTKEAAPQSPSQN